MVNCCWPAEDEPSFSGVPDEAVLPSVGAVDCVETVSMELSKPLEVVGVIGLVEEEEGSF